MEASQTTSLIHSHPGGLTEMNDQVAVEEPLEIRLDGHPVAVVMRTPGHDEELAAGICQTLRTNDRWFSAATDFQPVCPRISEEDYFNRR